MSQQYKSNGARQVVARHKSGTVITCSLNTAPINFGSGAMADLCLNSDHIPAISGRLLSVGADRVMVINLALPSMTMDDAVIPLYEPREWQSGSQIAVQDYVLEIIPANTVDSAADSRSTPQVDHEDLGTAGTTASFRNGSIEMKPAAAVETKTIRPDTGQDEAATALLKDRPLSRPAAAPEVASWIGLDVNDVTLDYAMDAPQPKPAAVPRRLPEPVPAVNPEDTLPKDWRIEGKLSVQLALKTLNFAPGERIRIPVSVQNTHTHTLELAAEIIGLPANWSIAESVILKVSPGQVKFRDVIVQTAPVLVDAPIQASLRLYDQVTPEIAIALPFQMVLKRHPDLAGWIDPPTASDREATSVCLTLQNHTLARMRVSVSGYADDPALRVSLPQSFAELIPGQSIQIPLNLEILQRPWFRTKLCRFGVSAQQGTRAPLDYPGMLWVRPRLWFLGMAVLLIALLWVGSLSLGMVLTVLPAASGLPATATSLPTETTLAVLAAPLTATSRPTIAPTSTAVATSVPVLIVTAASLPNYTDPRAPSCAAAIPAPVGWQPYSIMQGNNLFRLGVNHGTSADEIARVNCLPATDIIQVGQVILLPSP